MAECVDGDVIEAVVEHGGVDGLAVGALGVARTEERFVLGDELLEAARDGLFGGELEDAVAVEILEANGEIDGAVGIEILVALIDLEECVVVGVGIERVGLGGDELDVESRALDNVDRVDALLVDGQEGEFRRQLARDVGDCQRASRQCGGIDHKSLLV